MMEISILHKYDYNPVTKKEVGDVDLISILHKYDYNFSVDDKIHPVCHFNST